jgi:hypothetical protein
MPVHAANAVDEERHEADDRAVQGEPHLFRMPGEFVRMLVHQVVRILAVGTLDRRL